MHRTSGAITSAYCCCREVDYRTTQRPRAHRARNEQRILCCIPRSPVSLEAFTWTVSSRRLRDQQEPREIW